MADDSQKTPAEILKSAKRLSAQFQKGWAKLHPVNPKHLEAVRAAVREEWQKEQSESAEKQKKTKSSQKAQEPAKDKSQSQSAKSDGKSKGHSH